MLLVDLTDASGSFLPRVRDLVGKNPVVLVGTKVAHPTLQGMSCAGLQASQLILPGIAPSPEVDQIDLKKGVNRRGFVW